MPSKNSLRLLNLDLVSPGWEDYELLDSGSRRKLERFGPVQLIRFEPQAVWKPALNEARWNEAHAVYSLEKSLSAGGWVINKPLPPDWQVTYHDIRFNLAVTASRHIGIFPEQQPNWDWVAEKTASAGRPLSILNLFAYTGGMTAYASLSGATVTHVDASKAALQRARLNMAHSGLQDYPVRWIMDDAFQFVRREIRRKRKYDGMIMDPPAFGRGPNKQVWKFEQSLPQLLSACAQLLVEEPVLFLLTAYNVDQSIEEIRLHINRHLPHMSARLQCGSLVQLERSAGRKIQQAMFARWSIK